MSPGIPDELLYHRHHLWLRLEPLDCDVVIGLSDVGQLHIGEMLSVDLPRAGVLLDADERFGTVESANVVTDLVAPVSGEVLEFNAALKGNAVVINSDCYGAGWMLRIRVPDATHLLALMTAADYRAHVGVGKRVTRGLPTGRACA